MPVSSTLFLVRNAATRFYFRFAAGTEKGGSENTERRARKPWRKGKREAVWDGQKERGRGTEQKLKYSMPPLRLLADNYTSRGYKELGRSELKAPKISPQRGKGPATLHFRSSKRAGFSATAERKGNG